MLKQTCDFWHVTGLLRICLVECRRSRFPRAFSFLDPRAITPHNSHEQRWLRPAILYLSPISGVHTLTTGWFALATQSTELWLFRVSLGPQERKGLTMHPATSGHG